VTTPNRPNRPWPANGVARFVGGLPSRFEPSEQDLAREHEGEIVGAPFFSDGTTWVRIHVPGNADEVLVPVENLRP
jgi:hypothetical protein